MGLQDFAKYYTYDNIIKAYNTVKTNLKNKYNNAPDRDKAKALQDFLQNKMYGNKQARMQLLANAAAIFGEREGQLEKEIQRGINAGLQTLKDSPANLDQSIKNILIGSSSNKASITIGSFSNKIHRVKTLIETPPESMTSTEIKEIKKLLQFCDEDLKIITQTYSPKGDISVAFKDVQDFPFQEHVEALNEILNKYFNIFPMSPQTFGNVNEVLISSLSAEFIEQNTKNLDIKKVWQGTTKAGKNTNLLGNLKISFPEQNINKASNSYKYNKTIANGRYSIKLEVDDKGSLKKFDAFSSESTDGKLDILFTLPSVEQEKFRITLKTWDLTGTSTWSRGFDSILAYAITRITEENYMYNYAFLLNREKKEQYQKASNFAKLCVVVDALFGANQKAFVDTLVVDDKAGHIYVLPLKEIINNIEQYLDDRHFDKYNAIKLSSQFKKIFNLENYEGEQKLAMIRNILQQQRVLYKYTAIQDLAIKS